MSAGLLRNWHKKQVAKSKTPFEFFLKMHEFMYYEFIVSKFNAKEKIRNLFDK